MGSFMTRRLQWIVEGLNAYRKDDVLTNRWRLAHELWHSRPRPCRNSPESVLRLYRLEAGRFASRLKARPRRQNCHIPSPWSMRPIHSRHTPSAPPISFTRGSYAHSDVLEVAAWKAGDFRSQE
jgi:hypothetical protein